MDYHAARQNMVESQVRVNDVTDTPLQLAMRHVAGFALIALSLAAIDGRLLRRGPLKAVE